MQKWAWRGFRSRHVWPTVPEAGRVCLHQLKRQARCGSYVGTRILSVWDVLSQDRYLDTHIQRFITRVRELITLFLVEDDLFFPKFPRVPSQSRHAKQSLECWWQLLATTSNTQQCPFWNSILTLSSLLSFQKMNLKTYLIHKFPQFSLQRSNLRKSFLRYILQIPMQIDKRSSIIAMIKLLIIGATAKYGYLFWDHVQVGSALPPSRTPPSFWVHSLSYTAASTRLLF